MDNFWFNTYLKFKYFIECFDKDMSIRELIEKTGLSETTVNRYVKILIKQKVVRLNNYEINHGNKKAVYRFHKTMFDLKYYNIKRRLKNNG